MLNKFRLVAFATLALSITFTACKKSDDTSSKGGLTDAQVQVHNDDQNRVGNSENALADDANVALSENASFGGRLDGSSNLQTLICGATTALDTTSNPRKITITYNGLNCAGTETRTGTVVISMAQGMRWKDSGAVATIQVTNLRITRLSDNKSITINGTHTLTNVTGGSLIDLAQRGRPIVHTITSNNMTITFDDNTQRSWSVARKRTFSYNNGIVLSIIGTYSDNTTNGICEWGTTRFGTAFVTAITQPLVFRQDCNGRLVSGQIEHTRLSATATATFGLDASGNPVSCPNGAYYMKIVITRTGQQPVTVLLPY